MARNIIQFQKGMSLPTFLEKFGTEEACRKALFELRWPDGFHCPECGHHSYFQLKSRALIQCNRCHHQTSLSARTLFDRTKLPLRTWFLAIFLLTQSKSGLSAMALERHLGVSHNTAWLLKQKLVHAMRERDDSTSLTGLVQVDDAVWGGERRGGKRGRGAAGKTPFAAAVACGADGWPLAMRLKPLKGFRSDSIDRWRASICHRTQKRPATGCHASGPSSRPSRIGALPPAVAWPVLRSRSLPVSTPCSATSRTRYPAPITPFTANILVVTSALSPTGSIEASSSIEWSIDWPTWPIAQRHCRKGSLRWLKYIRNQ